MQEKWLNLVRTVSFLAFKNFPFSHLSVPRLVVALKSCFWENLQPSSHRRGRMGLDLLPNPHSNRMVAICLERQLLRKAPKACLYLRAHSLMKVLFSGNIVKKISDNYLTQKLFEMGQIRGWLKDS